MLALEAILVAMLMLAFAGTALAKTRVQARRGTQFGFNGLKEPGHDEETIFRGGDADFQLGGIRRIARHHQDRGILLSSPGMLRARPAVLRLISPGS